MTGKVLAACVLGGVLMWAWKQIGFIHMELPLSEQKRQSDIFAPTEPKYRRTQRSKVRSLTEWRQRYDAERKRA